MGAYIGTKYNKGLSRLANAQRYAYGHESFEEFESFSGPFPPSLSSLQFYANDTGKPMTGPTTGIPNNMYLNALWTSINAGQDANGYYGWWGTSGNTMNNFWSGADADAELRSAYNNIASWWGGPLNTAANISAYYAGGPNIPVPLPKGSDINTGAPKSTTGLGSIVNVIQSGGKDIGSIIGAITGAAGSVINSATSGLGNITGAGTPPPSPPPLVRPLSPFLIASFIAGFLSITAFVIAGTEKK